MKKIFVVFILSGALFALSLAPAFAADSWVVQMIGQPLIPKVCTDDPPPEDVNDCGLDQALQVIINVSKLIVAFSGSAALLVFTYGGVLWIMSAGNSEKIEQGKMAMVSAAIGMAIVLGAWLIVNFTILAITKGEVGGNATIFGKPWSGAIESQPRIPAPRPGAPTPVPF